RALHSPAPRRSSDLAGGVRQGVGHGGVRRGPQGARPAVLARRREAARARLPAARPVRAGAQGDRPLVRGEPRLVGRVMRWLITDRKSTRLNSSHVKISYAVFCLKKKKKIDDR